MDSKGYREKRMQIMNFAKDCIKEKYQSSEQPEDQLWFKTMLHKHQYIAGNKEFVFSVIDIEGRIYMNKIF